MLRLLSKLQFKKMGMLYRPPAQGIRSFKSKIEDPTEAKILSIIKKVQGYKGELKPNMELKKDIGVDSNNLVHFLKQLEKELLINIPVEKAITFRTLADLIRYLNELQSKTAAD